MVDNLSEAIRARMSEEAQWLSGIGDGWVSIVEELNDGLAELYPDYEILQIKQKYGGLRYYTVGVGTEGRALIDAAEAKSMRTCEVCGEPGGQDNSYWVETLCDTCRGKD